MTKIEALKQTMYNLENDILPYNWMEAESCNCGILASTLLGNESIWKHGFSETLSTGRGIFAGKAHCMTTGLPVTRVFQVLKDAGFTYEELLELEYLSNHNIRNKIGLESYFNTTIQEEVAIGFSQKENVIAYFKVWIEILEEQNQRTDITKQLAIIPLDRINESPDIVKQLVNQ